MSGYDAYNNSGNNSTSYYGAGAGAGGFVAGSPGGSQGSINARQTRNETLRPVTIKQLMDASQAHTDAEFVLTDGAELQSVTFVAVVRNIGTNTTNASYDVEDGTGEIEVRQWLESRDDDTGRTDGIELGKYVRIMGKLASFNNKRNIKASNVRPVTDHNEIFYHLMEAQYVHLCKVKGDVPRAGAVGGNRSDSNMGATTSAPAGQYNNTTYTDNPYSELPALQRQIMMIVVKDAQDFPDGVHVSRVAQQIPNGASNDDMASAVDALIGEGMLYTTSDDMHVLST